MPGNLFELEDVIVNIDVVITRFECDLPKCKGACCTMESDFGAPVTEEEIKKIEEILPIIKDYIPKEHYGIIKNDGFWYSRLNQLMISSRNNRECVFSYYDGDIAKCGIEKAYREGKVDFIKPISCHLFPIRIGNLGGDVLRFEEYTECEPAIEKGKETGTKLIDLCKDALRKKYGNKWYKKLIQVIRK